MKHLQCLLAMLVLASSFGCNYAKPKELPAEKKFALANDCSVAGKKYYDEFIKKYDDPPAHYTFEQPEYHYNSQLNTCLVHIHFYINQGLAASVHYNQVIDVLSNKALIFGWYRRDGQTESLSLFTPNSFPSTQRNDIQNYTSTEYFRQKDKLFSE